jgi:hypothetical protein
MYGDVQMPLTNVGEVSVDSQRAMVVVEYDAV